MPRRAPGGRPASPPRRDPSPRPPRRPAGQPPPRPALRARRALRRRLPSRGGHRGPAGVDRRGGGGGDHHPGPPGGGRGRGALRRPPHVVLSGLRLRPGPPGRVHRGRPARRRGAVGLPGALRHRGPHRGGLPQAHRRGATGRPGPLVRLHRGVGGAVRMSFSIDEWFVVTLARTIRDREGVFHGFGSPCAHVAMHLARRTHARDMLLVEGATYAVNPDPPFIPPTGNDWSLQRGAAYRMRFQEFFDAAVRGDVDRMFLSGVQLDPYGNTNVTVVR